ncbi:flagellar biosynthetic protein FliO [Nocardioides sp. NPDC092400]|uniref:flagellar biosynthetic protein FliO n=1 Tax=Nocardioides sp. NPDC092400 TaxID=3155196 RepID=UPI00342EE498
MLELVLRLVFSLAVVLGLVLLVARVAQRRLGTRSGAPLSVLHRQAVGRHASVAVVAVGGRTLLLGVTEQQVRMITELDGADLVPAEAATVTALPGVEREPTDGPAQQAHDQAGDQPYFAAVLHEQAAELARTTAAAGATAATRAARPGARRAARPTRPTRQDDGPLAGSLLSPATWRRAVEAVRGQAS